MHDRHESFHGFAKATKAITTELRQSAPSVPVIQAQADRLARFAPQIIGWFPPGSGPESGIRTRAKLEIWAQPDRFRAAADRFVAATQRFQSVAAAGDADAIRAAFPALGDGCKGCHDDFRGPDDGHH